MKKIVVIAIVACVVIGCVLAAGCTSTNQPDQTNDQNTVTNIVPAVTIDMKNDNKIGSTYAEGEILSLTFPSNGTTGYSWKDTQKDEGLTIEKTTTAGATKGEVDGKTVNLTGVPGTTTFWISADKPGTYGYTLKYMKSWEGEESAIATFFDEITVEAKEKDLVVDGPSLSLTFDTFNINPKAGEYILIKIPGNATTGYNWKASGNGLKIVDDYKVNDAPAGMVGVPGTFYIYVTAEKAGDYVITLDEARTGSEPIVSVSFGLKFV